MPEAYPPQQTYPQPGAQQAPVPALPLEVYGATDKGRQREGNEDAVYPHSDTETFPFQPGPDRLARKGQLLVVADGVGGARAGHEASHWAIRVAVERYYDLPGPDLGADLRTAIEIANSSLYQYLQSTGTQESGCTMAAAVIHGNTLYVANVGDSRVYLLRNGQMTRLTRDHTLTQQKIDQGLILPEQAEMDPDRSVLTRSLGARPTVQVDLFQPLQLAPGDVVLVCSDGLTDMLAEEEIGQLMDGSSTKRGARRLIAAANKRGGFDNISAVLARAGRRQAARGGLLGSAVQMSRRQLIVLAALALAVAVTLCALGGWTIWTAFGPRRRTPTPVAPSPETPIEATTTPTVAADTPDAVTPAATMMQDEATSTPASTFTLTPTRTPRPTPTPTPTNTPVPPSDTPEPKPEPGGGDGGGDGGDGGGEPPPPER